MLRGQRKLPLSTWRTICLVCFIPSFPERTPLHGAAENGWLNAVKLLVEAGARTDAKDKRGETALDVAKYYRHKEVVAFLKTFFVNSRGLNIVSRKSQALTRRNAGVSEKAQKLSDKTRGIRATPKTPSNSLPLSGADDFIAFVHNWGHPVWCVLAVRGSLGNVAKAYFATREGKRVVENVSVRPTHGSDNEIASAQAILQMQGSPWTVIIQKLCLPIDGDDLEESIRDAQSLSAAIKTTTLAFSGEDTSYAMGYHLYEHGKLERFHEWGSQTDSTSSEFSDLGFFLPTCYPVTDGREFWLAANPSLVEQIQSCNLVI